jgi:hypothetical protein
LLEDLGCTPGKYMVLRGTVCCFTGSAPLFGFREERKEGGFDVFWLVLGYSGLRLGPRIFINLMCEVSDTWSLAVSGLNEVETTRELLWVCMGETC